MSEECLGILGHTLCLGMLGRQGTGTEFAQGLLVHEVTHSVLLQELHLLVLV